MVTRHKFDECQEEEKREKTKERKTTRHNARVLQIGCFLPLPSSIIMLHYQ